NAHRSLYETSPMISRDVGLALLLRVVSIIHNAVIALQVQIFTSSIGQMDRETTCSKFLNHGRQKVPILLANAVQRKRLSVDYSHVITVSLNKIYRTLSDWPSIVFSL